MKFLVIVGLLACFGMASLAISRAADGRETGDHWRDAFPMQPNDHHFKIGPYKFGGAAKLSHGVALSRIQAVGISISSSGGCSDRNNPTCTSLEQVNENSISGITTLKTASGCGINVTGGTEVGHASGTYSHWNGYKIDISLNTCIQNYIVNSFEFIGNRPGDGAPQYRSAAGNIYAKESNHWDILYY